MKAVLVALLVPLVSTVALAETRTPTQPRVAVVVVDGPPGSDQAIAPPAPCTPVKATLPQARGLDALQAAAASGRGLVASTAITVPEGRVEASLQTLVPFAAIVGLNAGITKSTELWVDAAAAIPEEGDAPKGYGAGIKQVVARSRTASLAVTASLRKFSDGNDHGWQSLGAVGSLCVDDGCGLMVSGAVQRLFGYPSQSSYDATTSDPGVTLLTVGASMGGPHTRLLVEALAVEGDTLGFLGVRFGGAQVAVDLAIVRPLGQTDESLPWLGVTGRM